MELKEGMYVRYVPTLGEYIQKISKITKMENRLLDIAYYLDNESKEVYSSHFDEIINASFDLFDLIEVGDFLDNHCVEKIKDDTIYLNDGYFIDREDIEEFVSSVVTKEQFEACKYVIERDE